MVRDLVLVPERAQDVGEQDQGADRGDARQPQEQPGERRRHLPQVPGPVLAREVIDEVGRVGDRGVDDAAWPAERDPPAVAGRHPDQVAHHEVHGDEHERDAAADRDQPDPPVALHRHPDAERHEDERRVLLDEQRQHDEHDVQTPSRFECGIDGEADEHAEERVGMEVLEVRPARRRGGAGTSPRRRARTIPTPSRLRPYRYTGIAPAPIASDWKKNMIHAPGATQ